MKVVSTEQMRQLDALTIADYGIPGEELMERAGHGVALMADDLARSAGFTSAPARLVAGRGNNGGDVYVAARHLHGMGYRVEVWLAGERRRVGGDAAKQLERLRSAGIAVEEVSTPQDWDDVLASHPGGPGIVVDGILGTGIRGPARGLAAGAIQFVNFLGEAGPVVAVDVPSGLNSDTGVAEGDTVVADMTATMGFPKRGLIQPCAAAYVGAVDVVDIGIPDELSAPIESAEELITLDDARAWLPRRPRASHKGDYGHVLVIAGARGFAGAAALGGRAIVATLVPDAMVHAGPETECGSLGAAALSDWAERLGRFDAVLAGPGLTTHADTGTIVHRLLERVSGALVLDADALNVMAGELERIQPRGASITITPHPGEMSRLLGWPTERVQENRFGCAGEAAARLGGVVVLKGCGTVVAAPGRPLGVNLTGNPGMARGGMGDVLAGLLAGLVAQGIEAFDAARLAVLLHGRAGDRVAWATSRMGMSASDVVEALAHGFADLSPR